METMGDPSGSASSLLDLCVHSSSFVLNACRVASDDPVSMVRIGYFPYPFTVFCICDILHSSLLMADGMGARVLAVNC